MFASTLEKIHDPLFRAIDFECDPDKRKARFAIDGVVEAHGTPIINPITGNEHRVSVNLPNGFEFTRAEFASGRIKTGKSPIPLQWEQRHSHMTNLRITGRGPVRD